MSLPNTDERADDREVLKEASFHHPAALDAISVAATSRPPSLSFMVPEPTPSVVGTTLTEGERC
jgi:hypothetical protein